MSIWISLGEWVEQLNRGKGNNKSETFVYISFLGFILMYFAYVIVVILGRIIYQKWKKKVLGTGDIPSKPHPHNNFILILINQGPQSKPVGQEMATSTSTQYVVISNGDVGTADENGRVDIPRDGSESPPPPKEEVMARPTVIVVDMSDDKEISGRHKIVKIEVMNEQWMDG